MRVVKRCLRRPDAHQSPNFKTGKKGAASPNTAPMVGRPLPPPGQMAGEVLTPALEPHGSRR